MERISIKEAAKMLGYGPETIRWRMFEGKLKIGDIYKSRNGKTHRFIIYRELVEKHLEKLGEEKK